MPVVVPLRNVNNNCCYNVILQALMHTQGLRRAIGYMLEQIDPSDPDFQMPKVKGKVTALVGDLFSEGSDYKGDKHLQIALYLAKLQHMPYGQQHDALEVYEKLITQMEREMQGKEKVVVVPKNYHRLVDKEYRAWEAKWREEALRTTLTAFSHGFQIDQYRCLCCKSRVHSQQLFNSIRLPLMAGATATSEPVNLRDLLGGILEEVEQDDARTCEGKCKSQQKKSLITRFYRAPEVVTLVIQRTIGYNPVKTRQRVEIPDTLDLQPALVQGTVPRLYKLSTIVMHHGIRIDHGHYTAVVHDGVDYQWVDDDRIEKLDPVGHREMVERDAYMVFYTVV